MITEDKPKAGKNDNGAHPDDPRWLLVERILTTPEFEHSARLSDFLRLICRLALEGRSEEISEQYLGEMVFGRPRGYDSSADTIVRSHALRLRHRLEEYFSREAANETLRIEIPRGHYVPRFYIAPAERPVESALAHHSKVEVSEPTTPQSGPEAVAAIAPPPQRWFQHSVFLSTMTAFVGGIVLGAIGLAIFYHFRPNAVAVKMAGMQSDIEREFWNGLFPANGRTLIVPGDSGLVLYETFTGEEVNLTNYINGAYTGPAPGKKPPITVSKETARNLSLRRYTSVVDLDLSSRLMLLPEWNAEHAATVYARDLRPSDAARSNLILIGSREANPWVSLVEPSMNYVLTRDNSGEFYFLNRQPHDGELKEYRPKQNSGSLGAADLYGDVAYLPNPSGDGMVLVLSGLWMSGTQSAGNFVLNGDQFSSWLKSIANVDGSIPPFELLISTKNLQGNAAYSSIIAKRTMPGLRPNAAREQVKP